MERGAQKFVVRTLRWAGLAALSLLLAMAGHAPAAAQGGNTGMLTAVAGPGFAKGAPVAVVPEEFNDVNSRLQDDIARALAAQGYKVDQNAKLELTFDTEMTDRTEPMPGDARLQDDGTLPRALLEGTPDGGGGADIGPDPAVQLETPLEIPLGPSAPIGRRSEYSLRFTLGQSGKPPTWQGTITAQLSRRDPYQAGLIMVRPLVAHIGQNAKNEPVPLN